MILTHTSYESVTLSLDKPFLKRIDARI